MHHHYCWGFVYPLDRLVDTWRLFHLVDPGMAVLQHYKRCHFERDECRRMMNDTSSDDTVLKYRTELIRAVSQKMASIYK